MVFKGIVAATAAVALSVTPAVAAANGSAAAATAAAPSSETVTEGSEMFGSGGFIIPLLAVIAVILGILAATSDDEDLPSSP